MPDKIVITATCEACVEWTMVTPDYNKNFVEELKSKIPMDKREWQPGKKCWLIQGDWVHVAADIAYKYFPKAELGWVE